MTLVNDFLVNILLTRELVHQTLSSCDGDRNLLSCHKQEIYLTDDGVENLREPDSRRLLGCVLKKTKVAVGQKLYGLRFSSD